MRLRSSLVYVGALWPMKLKIISSFRSMKKQAEHFYFPPHSPGLDAPGISVIRQNPAKTVRINNEHKAEKRSRSEVPAGSSRKYFAIRLSFNSPLGTFYIRIPILDNLLQGKYRINADDKTRK